MMLLLLFALFLMFVVSFPLRHSRPLLASVESLLGQNRAPFLLNIDESINIDNNVIFQNDFVQYKGSDCYSSAGTDFRKSLDQLNDAQYKVDKISSVSNGILVNWSVDFLPDVVAALSFVGNMTPGIKVVFYDILDRERFVATGFTWENFKKFIEIIVTKGEMLLPKAKICAQTQLEFVESETDALYTLKKSTEKINLVRSVDAGLLKNRVIAGHLVEFAAAMKPNSIAFNDWDDITVTRLQIQKVPGMRQFDIDGLEPERQQSLIETSKNILGYAFGVVSLFGLVFALQVLDKINN